MWDKRVDVRDRVNSINSIVAVSEQAPAFDDDCLETASH